MLTMNIKSQFTHPTLLNFSSRSVSFEDSEGSTDLPHPSNLNPHQILEVLLQGNQQFVEMRAHKKNHNSVRLSAVAQGQKPFAAVLNYAKLNNSTEEIFNQKFGDLFVINSPGHSTNYQDISSIEYGVLILGVKTVVILADCYYSQEGVERENDPQTATYNVNNLKLSIQNNKILLSRPSAAHVKENILSQVAKLNSSPLLRQFVRNKELTIVSGMYDEETGLVNIF
jgi:carbonic anhydrase